MRQIKCAMAKPRGHCGQPMAEVGKEGGFWNLNRWSRRAARHIVLCARRLEIVTRRPGQRNGALGHVALEVLAYMVNLTPSTGRLEPSIDQLCRACRRSRDAIVRAIERLDRMGFLLRLRRFRRVETAEEGLNYRRARTAYALALPARAARLLRAVPLPDDVKQALADRAVQVDAYLHQLNLRELPSAVVNDRPLADLLAIMGANIMAKVSKSA